LDERNAEEDKTVLFNFGIQAYTIPGNRAGNMQRPLLGFDTSAINALHKDGAEIEPLLAVGEEGPFQANRWEKSRIIAAEKSSILR
jgi:hypothetical protein